MSYSQLTGTPTIPTNNNQLTNGSSYITASSTDTLTNKSMSYSQLTGTPTIPTNNNQLTNGSSYITASSTDTLTNKSMSYSQLTGTPTIPTNNNQLTNGSGYITASSTNTLTNKTMSISQITNLQTEIDSKQATLTAGTNITITGSTISASGGGGSSVWSGSGDIYYTGGDVGIGTTSPQTKLHVETTITANDTTVPMDSDALNNTVGLYLSNRYSASFNYGVILGALFNATGYIQSISNDGNGRNLVLNPGGGNVGIGTTSPVELLHVKGQLSLYTNEISGVVSVQTSQAGSSNIIFACNNLSNSSQSNGLKWKSLAQLGGANNYNKTTAAIYFTPEDEWFRGALTFHTNSSGTGTGASTERMRITNTGNVGIGTTSPLSPLHIENPNASSNYPFAIPTANSTSFSSGVHSFLSNRYTDGNYNQFGLVMGTNGACYYLQHLSTNFNNYYNLSLNPRGGNVGIGTTTPDCPLEVEATSSVAIPLGRAYWYNGEQGHSALSRALAIHAHGAVWSDNSTGFIATSDRRIKKNIVDVPDNLALEMVRNIPCRYYEYKDNLYSGTDKTIGFIAQEVKEILPMAISIQTSIIPNELRKLENVSWEQIENTYKLITDLQDVSGVKYRFYVSNDVSGNDEIMKDVVGNSDNSFTFDEQWNNVFCYGKEVNDFHTLDKQKLFALNFSATQEIDRIQQQHIIDISNAQATIQPHETTIQQHETTIQQQQLEIENLKLVNQDMNNQINMIKEHLGL